MKLENIINADFANLLYDNSYKLELLEFKNEELIIKSYNNTRELVKELQFIFAENNGRVDIEVKEYVANNEYSALIYIK